MNKYQILKEIESYNSELHYRALDVVLGIEVRLRKIKKYTREIKHHTNIQKELVFTTLVPEVYDTFISQNGEAVIIERLIVGNTIEKLLEEYKNWDFVWSIYYYIIEVFNILHLFGYVYGSDLSGLLWDGNRIYIVDFRNIKKKKDIKILKSEGDKGGEILEIKKSYIDDYLTPIDYSGYSNKFEGKRKIEELSEYIKLIDLESVPNQIYLNEDIYKKYISIGNF